MTDTNALIRQLGLSPHPEGGFFKETYRSLDLLPKESLPGRYNGPRCAGTAIYYLLEKGDFSALHRVQSDETFHLYLGGPVEILTISPDGRGETAIIGTNFSEGQVPQFTVPKGSIQGLHLLPEAELALLGATVAPGFDFADFSLVSRQEASQLCPRFDSLIASLTRS